jgi:hypothetical protein
MLEANIPLLEGGLRHGESRPTPPAVETGDDEGPPTREGLPDLNPCLLDEWA